MRKYSIGLVVCISTVAGCAADAPSTSAAAPAEVVEGTRVLVRVAGDAPGVMPDESPTAIETRASAAAGVPVRYVAASGSQWHALLLLCKPAECEQALQRLATDRTRFPVVQPDETRRR